MCLDINPRRTGSFCNVFLVLRILLSVIEYLGLSPTPSNITLECRMLRIGQTFLPWLIKRIFLLAMNHLGLPPTRTHIHSKTLQFSQAQSLLTNVPVNSNDSILPTHARFSIGKPESSPNLNRMFQALIVPPASKFPFQRSVV